MIDIFCTVIDNFGDIGVSWRLAKQLAYEHHYPVRLWVDDLPSFKRLCPTIDVNAAQQTINGIEIRLWAADFPEVEPATLVIEAFGCRLPERYLDAMQRQTPAPTWLNLEYLSAEDWVEGCHKLQSIHPQRGLKQTFFYPGFTAKTGGLLRERDLLQQRDAFQADAALQAAFWASLNLPAPLVEETRVSLFCYENEAIAGLLAGWIDQAKSTVCLIPEGRALTSVQAYWGETLSTGQCYQRGALSLYVLPFMSQAEYDHLLWACDFNIVRGEDSFVRAQWAAKPFLWHIYPQDEDAHWPKLDAFLGHYLLDLDPDLAQSLQQLWHNFNAQQDPQSAWKKIASNQQRVQEHAKNWAKRLSEQQDLATQLVNVHLERVQSRVS